MLMAGNVPDGGITSTKLAPGTIHVFLVVEQHRPRDEQQRDGRLVCIAPPPERRAFPSSAAKISTPWQRRLELLTSGGRATGSCSEQRPRQQCHRRASNGRSSSAVANLAIPTAATASFRRGEQRWLAHSTADGNIGPLRQPGPGSGCLSACGTRMAATFPRYGGPSSAA
jgi:hypothetical protein